MTAIPQSLTQFPNLSVDEKRAANEAFLNYLPAVTTHASIQFRHLNKSDREEAIAEATAAAFLNFRKVTRRTRLQARWQAKVSAWWPLPL